MENKQAVQVLYQAASMAKLPAHEHEQLAKAATQLVKFLEQEEKEQEPVAKDKKSS